MDRVGEIDAVAGAGVTRFRTGSIAGQSALREHRPVLKRLEKVSPRPEAESQMQSLAPWLISPVGMQAGTLAPPLQ